MGNSMGGVSSTRAAKVMKINGELFKLKTPAKVFDIIKDYPDHILLDSEEFLRFNLRAKPLDPEEDLKPNKIYLLVELPKFPSPLRRVRSGVRETRRDFARMTQRTVSDLPMATTSTATTDSDDGGLVDSPVCPTRVKMRFPKAVVEKIMAESRDNLEVAEKIRRIYLEDPTAGNGGGVAAPVVEECSGGGTEERESGEEADVDRHCFKVMCRPYHRKYKRLA